MGKKARSAFVITWRELERSHPKAANEVRENRASAFVLDGKPHLVQAEGERWNMHGTVVAQRRSGGNVWVVISGLSGPATYGVAKRIIDIQEELPFSKGKNSPILWAPIKVPIKLDKNRKDSGDHRQVLDDDTPIKTQIWPKPTAEEESEAQP